MLFMEYFIIFMYKQIFASGEAAEKITDVVGKCRYNAKISYSWDMNNQDDEGNPRVIDNKALILLREFVFSFQIIHIDDLAVITKGGCRVFVKGMVEYDLEKITEEQAAELENDFDDIEAPPGPYKIQPENQGNEE